MRAGRKVPGMGVLDRFRLDGKRAFVTGGSRGLGREMALGLAEAGANLVLVGREQAALDHTATEIRARGREAFTIQADVGQPAEAERACRAALAEHGPVDILINNVGGRRVDIPTQDMPVETWQTLIDLNLTSTFVCTKILGGAMIGRGRGGRIINVASVSGLIANRGIGGRSYETGKAAVIAFTRAVAADWAPHRHHGERHRARRVHDRPEPPLEDASTRPSSRRSRRRCRWGSTASRRISRRSPSTSRATPRGT